MSQVDPSMDRRAVLAAGAGLAAAAAVPNVATAQSDDLESWLSDANNYDWIQDFTGQDRVTVDVGAGNGLAFGPAAIRVDPGTTVTWEWTGSGGPHNVASVDGAFRSGDTTPEAGTTYERIFEEPVEFRYVCEPHQGAGMKGAVVVGGGGGEVDPAAQIEEFLADANNYDGVEDLRGEDAVSVDVGAGNGLAFDPAAIHVDPGTTVSWEWTGNGGQHNVAEVDGVFRSGDATPEQGTTFEQTFEEAGIARYVCEPHQGAGMKGAVVVGDGAGIGGGGSASGGDGAIGSGTFAAVTGVFLVPILFALALLGKEIAGGGDDEDRIGHGHL